MGVCGPRAPRSPSKPTRCAERCAHSSAAVGATDSHTGVPWCGRFAERAAVPRHILIYMTVHTVKRMARIMHSFGPALIGSNASALLDRAAHTQRTKGTPHSDIA